VDPVLRSVARVSTGHAGPVRVHPEARSAYAPRRRASVEPHTTPAPEFGFEATRTVSPYGATMHRNLAVVRSGAAARSGEKVAGEFGFEG
jgi:hypothetical protein